jgi:hypothetical protein
MRRPTREDEYGYVLEGRIGALPRCSPLGFGP